MIRLNLLVSGKRSDECRNRDSGRSNNMTQNTESQVAPTKKNAKAKTAPQKPGVVPAKGKAIKKATPAKDATKPPANATKAKSKAKEPSTRQGSKTEQILAFLKRDGGVTAAELRSATGWQAHSVRGFLSGTVGKKMGLTVVSAKNEAGRRTYSLAS
jgi:Protein of unknown function (DUF3489)